MKSKLVWALLVVGSPCWAQSAAPAPAATPTASAQPLIVEAQVATERPEPNVQHAVIEDKGSKIDELRVRGQAQRIVVTPKVGPKKSYEIITDSSGREMFDGSGASRGAVGKRVWNVLNF